MTFNEEVLPPCSLIKNKNKNKCIQYLLTHQLSAHPQTFYFPFHRSVTSRPINPLLIQDSNEKDLHFTPM